MDLTFKTEDGVFNYRVCAIILQDDCLLATKNKDTPYYYLPGGRVKLHETAEAAMNRELVEELGIPGRIVRPLWLNQSFFTEDVTGQRFHEICFYFLVDYSGTELASRGSSFFHTEGQRRYLYQWIPLNELSEKYLYPQFIKEKIHNLPEALTLLTEYE